MNMVISTENNETNKKDDNDANRMEVEVEVHRGQTETHEKLKRKWEKLGDNNTDRIDRTYERGHEQEFEIKENKALGTDRKLIDGKKIERNTCTMNVSSCEDINMDGYEENYENVKIENEITGTYINPHRRCPRQ